MLNQKVPKEFQPAFEKALNHFPELFDKYIFVYKTRFFGVQHAFRAYPPIFNLLSPKSKWVYLVAVNKRRSVRIIFSSLSLEEQVGLLAHELSHSSAYSDFSRIGLIIFSIRYAFSKKFVKRIEEETDLRVISRGAGKCLFMERIALFKFRLSRPYPETEDTYITPVEVLENLKKYPHLYTDKDLAECSSQLELIVEKLKLTYLPSRISGKRKIKHSLKTLMAFLPEFLKIFYIVVIKKAYITKY